MLIPHHHEEAHIDAPLDEVSRNLIENLHLRWGYGVFQVEEYTGDDDEAVCVVYGVAHPGSSIFVVLVVRLEQADRFSTYVIIECGQPNTGGYPFNRPDTLTVIERETQYTSKAVDDILRFCTTPHGEGRGVADMMRNLFERVFTRSGQKDKRHYKHKG